MSLDAIKPGLVRRNPNPNFIPSKPKRFRVGKWFLLLVVLIIIATASVAGQILSKTNQIFTNQGNIFSRFTSLIISPDKPLIGETEGTVNVLLMGLGGIGHDGAHLTDTMIVANLNTQTNEVVLTSIPRDFYLNLSQVGFNKINAAYAYAYQKNPDTAGLSAIAAAEQMTGLTIPYYAVIDFQGFVKAVNDIGGVDVVVDHTFTDATFPNDYPYDTKGYIAPITFTQGPTHMDGRTALIFARSRHSENANEGSDFARSERQKKILAALKARILSLKLSNLTTLNNLLSDFTNNFRTNLEPFELKRLADLSAKINNDNVYSFSLEPEGNLICSALIDPATGRRAPAPTPAETPTAPAITPTKTSPVVPAPMSGTDTAPAIPVPTITREYVVQPCEGKTLADIHAFVTQAPILAKLKKEAANVEVQNSTNQTGLAAKLFDRLTDLGLTIKYTAPKSKVVYDQTILYDNSHGGKPHTLDYLKSKYTLTVSDVNYPASSADFVIIIGKDAL